MIQLKFNAVTTEDDEDQCLCNTYNYDVMWSEEGDDVIKIGQGTIMLYLFSRTHHEKYISIEDVFYENYHTEIYKTLFEDGSMKDEFMFDIMDSNGNLNVLVPDRLEIFEETVKNAKTVIWNGPLGVCEFDKFEVGTKAVATMLSKIDAIKSSLYIIELIYSMLYFFPFSQF